MSGSPLAMSPEEYLIGSGDMELLYFALTLIGGLIIGYYFGYLHGKLRELYEVKKRDGILPEDLSWTDFLGGKYEDEQ